MVGHLVRLANDADRERSFVLRSLEENRFWLRIMKEHALFLSEGFNRRDTDHIRRANGFFALFDGLLTEALGFRSPIAEQIFRFNEDVIRAVKDFRNFKQDVLTDVILCRIDGFNFPLLIDHIRREAEYFITVLFKLNEGIDEPIEARIVRQQPSPPCVPLVGGDPQPVASARKPSPAVIESRLDPPWGNYVKIID